MAPQEYHAFEAGLTLDLTPHILDSDMLQLDIMLSRSDLAQHTSTRPPDIRSNKVDVSAVMPNGQTMLLGGMLKSNKGAAKVPILGDIPLLGGLFRSDNGADAQSKLYLFVKAEIIQPDGTLKGPEALSEKNRQAFEKHELEFQTNQNWPGIKVKRIDPPKILESR